MKILKINIKNIHSLKGLHSVDFEKEPLASAGLFAITGPTGAGKSTLLDVITLALYNKIPRLGSFSNTEMEKFGSVVTHDASEAFAEIEYESQGRKYRSLWKIQQNNKGKWKDYEMELASLPDREIIESKKSEVPRANEKVIGLNYEQFRKSILLAQGEFAQFLKADENEQAKLLMELTGAQIYQSIGKMAFEKNREIQQEVIHLQNQVQAINLISEEDLEKLLSESITVQKELPSLEKEINLLQSKIKTFEQFNHFRVLSGQLKDQISEHASKVEAFAPSIEKWQKNEKILPHISVINEISRTDQDQKILEITISSTNEKYEKLKYEFSVLINEISRNLQEPVDQENGQKILKACEQNYLDKMKDLSILQKKGEDLKYTYEKNIGQLSPHLKDQIEEAEQFFKNDPDKFSFLWKSLENFDETNVVGLEKQLEELAIEIQKNILLKEKIEQVLQIKADLISSKKKIVLSQEIIQKHTEKIKEQEVLLEEVRNKLALLQKEKEKKWQMNQLNDLRAHLHNGQPCPLCGSVEHPYCLDEKIKAYLNENIELDKENLLFNNLLSTLQNEKEKLHTELGKLSSEKDKEQNLILKISDFTNSHTISNPEEILKKVNETLVLSQKSKEDVLNQLDKIKLKAMFKDLTEIGNLRETYKKLKVTTDSLVLDKNPTSFFADKNTQWDNLSREIVRFSTVIAEQKNRMTELSQRLSELNVQIMPFIFELGYDSLEAVKLDMLSESETNEIADKIEKMKLEENSLKTRLEDVTENLEKILLQSPEIFNENHSELKINLVRYNETKVQYLTKLGEINKEIEINELNKTKKSEIESHYNHLKENNKVWEDLNELIGDREGKKYSKFAQNLTLQHLITLANKRLRKLTDRYQLDFTNIQDDLTVIDHYQLQVKRSVKTLSGGESFLVSLAMALSLSDLSSNKIKIQSLFIDEGFGTLDQETLDIAMENLERLQNDSGRMIGIISHVESLKERIFTQIDVRKSQSGFSHLVVKTL